MGVSIRQGAKLLGISHEGLRKLILRGLVSKLPDGTLDPAVLRREYAANLHPGRGKGGAGNADAGPDPTHGYRAARAVRESFEARLREMEYRQKSGELVSRTEVREAAFKVSRRARDMLLAVASRLGPVLAGTSDPRECIRLIRTETDRVAAEMAKLEEL